MKERTIAVVTAGLTTPSSTRLLADQLAAAVRDVLDGRGIPRKVVVIELRDHAHDLTNNLLTGFPSEELRGVLETVVQADALIAVTPTFSASYNGLFKTFFDVLDDKALVGKPVLIAATGGTPQSAQVSTAFATSLVATVKDSGGNPVSGATVHFVAPASGARGSGLPIPSAALGSSITPS